MNRAIPAAAAALALGALTLTPTGLSSLDVPGPSATRMNPYAFKSDCRATKSGFLTLACTVYFEGRNQPRLGQIAIAKTVLRRTQDPRYPHTIHGVVWQKSPSVQYDWTREPRIKSGVPVDRRAWRNAVDAAELAVNTVSNGLKIESRCNLDNLIRYHERHVHPVWNGYKARCRIGDHIFYSEERARSSKAG